MGDGTTTVAVLAGELCREAEKLLQGLMHPQTVIRGYRQAVAEAHKELMKCSRDNKENAEDFKEDLMNIARTTLSSKLLSEEREHFARLAVDAVLRVGETGAGAGNLDYIKIIKKAGGSMKESFLDEGFILEKSISVGCPTRKEKPRVIVANTPMDYDKIKIHSSKVQVDSMDKVAEIELAEKEKMKVKVEKILAHKPDVFINRQLIYNYPEQLMAEKGVMVIEHADFDGTERLAAVLGAQILSTFDQPDLHVLGECELIEQQMLGEDKVIKFSGCKANQACSIVLRGSGRHILDEAERSLHDALCVLMQTLKNSKVVFGGGHTEIRMANAVERLAQRVKGKEGMAIEAFARALRAIPTAIADNAGYDSAELIQNLRAELNEGHPSAGLNMYKGVVGDMEKLGVTECLRVKEQALVSASEACEMILRVDEVIKCAPRKRQQE